MVSRTTLWRCFLALVLVFGNIFLPTITKAEVPADVRQLYFSLMVSSAAGLNTSGVVPAVERALRDINNDPTLLPGYSFNYTSVADTKVKYNYRGLRSLLANNVVFHCVVQQYKNSAVLPGGVSV